MGSDGTDMLSRMMDQPEDAWKSMDMIDARDFEIAPLAAMCPNYFAYCALHAEQGSAGPDSVDVKEVPVQVYMYYYSCTRSSTAVVLVVVCSGSWTQL